MGRAARLPAAQGLVQLGEQRRCVHHPRWWLVTGQGRPLALPGARPPGQEGHVAHLEQVARDLALGVEDEDAPDTRIDGFLRLGLVAIVEGQAHLALAQDVVQLRPAPVIERRQVGHQGLAARLPARQRPLGPGQHRLQPRQVPQRLRRGGVGTAEAVHLARQRQAVDLHAVDTLRLAARPEPGRHAFRCVTHSLSPKFV